MTDHELIKASLSDVLQQRTAAFLQGDLEVAPMRPAATVVMVTDTSDGLKVYLQLRARTMAFAAGMYVFPGGAVEEQDVIAAGAVGFGDIGEDTLPARFAAVRETREESGFEISDPRSLSYIAHWVTPEVEPKRFDTRFYATVVDDPSLATETSLETEGDQWVRPQEAIEQQSAGEIAMLPPTLSVVSGLARLDVQGFSAHAAIDDFASIPVVPLLPVPIDLDRTDGVTQWDLVDLRTREGVR